MPREISFSKQKILLVLFKSLELGCSYTFKKQAWVLKSFSREWKKINKNKLRDEIRQLYQSRMIRKRENKDGSITITLTEKGKMKALTFYFENMKLNKGNWDGKWRMVTFDIPEKKRKGRDALRNKIKELGFYELQKSVWIYPFKCKDEIDFIIEFFGLRRYVRFVVVDSIDNEPHLKAIFKLKK